MPYYFFSFFGPEQTIQSNGPLCVNIQQSISMFADELNINV